jgi:GTP-binding protein Era
MENTEFKSGFIGIIGRPNVGKSTLLNNLVNRKVAITSAKPQTTRNKIRCIVNRRNAQLVFVDTPGFHKPKDPLGKHLNRAVRDTLKEVDIVLFMVDPSMTIGRGDAYIAKDLVKVATPIMLVLNKIDKLKGSELEDQLKTAKELGDFHKIIPLSAKTGENIGELLDDLVSLLPLGPKYYPDEMITDQPEKLLIGEFIREKVLDLTSEEIPHSVAVEIEDIVARKGKNLIDVFALIFVERNSQKGILIGKGGRMLKEVGKRARSDIEKLLGTQINLQLKVKLKKKWRRDESALHRFGYD